jgi:hypothetical protein
MLLAFAVEVSFLSWLFNRSITTLQSAYILWEDFEQTSKALEPEIIRCGLDKAHCLRWADPERAFKILASDKIIAVGLDKTHESVSTVCWLMLPDVWHKGRDMGITLQNQGSDVEGDFEEMLVDNVVTHLKRVKKRKVCTCFGNLNRPCAKYPREYVEEDMDEGVEEYVDGDMEEDVEVEEDVDVEEHEDEE